MVQDIIYHPGDTVEVKMAKSTLVFTKAEWLRAIKRGKSVLRNRQTRKREEKRTQTVVDERMEFPKFH